MGSMPVRLLAMLIPLCVADCEPSKGSPTTSRSAAPATAAAPARGAAANRPKGDDVPDPVAHATASAATPPAAPPPAGALIWEGSSGGVRIRWSEQDITAKPEKASSWSFSVARDFRKEDEAYSADQRHDKNLCRWGDQVSILSVVGPIMTLEHKTYSECAHEAHPAGETRYAAVDLSPLSSGGAASSAVDLAKYFGAPVLLEALRKDAVVRKALAEDGPVGAPRPRGAGRSLPDLLRQLGGVTIEEPCATFPEDWLKRFAFHHLEKSMVAVRLGLPGYGACRDALTQLGLLLPIPSALSEALAAADARREGFLMKDAAAIARNRTTSLEAGSSEEEIDNARNAEP